MLRIKKHILPFILAAALAAAPVAYASEASGLPEGSESGGEAVSEREAAPEAGGTEREQEKTDSGAEGAACGACGAFEGGAGALTVYVPNPLTGGPDEPEAPETSTLASPLYLGSFSDIGSAGEALREAMVERVTDVQFDYDLGYTGDSYGVDAQVEITNIIYAAMAHTGKGNEGDYLGYQYGGYSRSMDTADNRVYTISLSFYWYTSAEEEAEVTARLEEIYASFKEEATDYQRLKEIYDYIAAYVTYDYGHLSDSGYKHQYTAYAGLIDGTCVCQGYACLLYRMANDFGIDCRIESGTGGGENHAWNIVKMGELYYYCDVTWDSSRTSWSYFLKGSDSFLAGHTPNSGHLDGEWTELYPMSPTDYEPSEEDDPPVLGEEAFAVYEDGVLAFYQMRRVPRLIL